MFHRASVAATAMWALLLAGCNPPDAAPVIDAFTADRSTVTRGDTVRLTATFRGGTGVVTPGERSIESGAPFDTGPLTADTTFTLTVTDAHGLEVSQPLTVVAVDAPAISSFTATPAILEQGGQSQLHATFTGGAGTLDHGLGEVSSGALRPTGALDADTTFTLTVTNPAGASVTATAQVRVVREPLVLSFTAARSTVTAGEATELTVTFLGGTARIDPGLGEVQSGVPISTGALDADTAFTVTVLSPAGAETKQTLTVAAAPRPTIAAFAAAKATLTSGQPATLTAVFTGGTGVIDQGLGNVTSGAPVSTMPLGGSTEFTLTVTNPAGTRVTAKTSLTVVAAPAIATFAASRSTVTVGDPVSFTPTFSGGTGTLDGTPVTSGAAVTIPTLSATRTFTLVVTNAAGDSVARSTTVTAVPAPSIMAFTAARPTLTAGQSTALTASFDGGTATLSPGASALVSSQPFTVAPLATTLFTLTVTNPAGATVTQTLTVTVVPAAAISAFSAAASAVTKGGSTTLTGTFSGGTGALEPGLGAVSSGFSVPTGALQNDTTFVLTVTNAAGDAVARSVTVQAVSAPQIQGFTAARPTVTSGQTVGLTGTFTGGTGSIAGVGAVTSPFTVTSAALSGNTSFTLTVTNALGASTTSSVSVAVVPAPTIASFSGTQRVVQGGYAKLTASFANGTGAISPGVGSITSGSPVTTFGVEAATTFTLTVTNAAGDSVTATTQVGVGVDRFGAVPGDQHSCAIHRDGRVKCWGKAGEGQLGLGDTVDRKDAPQLGTNLPWVDLGTGRTAVQLSLAWYSTCALLDDGTLKCWGWGNFGQLGNGSTTTLGDGPNEMGDALPRVDLGPGRTVRSVSSLYAGHCALLDDGTVKCWGSGGGALGQGDFDARGDNPNEMGANLPPIPLGTGRTAVQLAAYGDIACAILDDGSLKCWGDNAHGQLGQGDTVNRGTAPGQLGNALPAISLGTGLTATQVAIGKRHVCARLSDATVKCWGRNEVGQLGNTTANNVLGDAPGEMGDALPRVPLGTGLSVASIHAGEEFTCALLQPGSVIKCFGHNLFGELGQGHTTPLGLNASQMGDGLPSISLGTGRTPRAFRVGTYHLCATLDDATDRCWGYNDFGQLGLGTYGFRGDEPNEMGDALPPVMTGF